MKDQMTFEEMFNQYVNYRRMCGRKEFTIYSNITRFFNRRKNYDTPYLTQQMIDDWCAKSEGETNVSRSIRVFSILSFLRYVVIEKKWVDLKVPKTPPHAYETAIPHSFTNEELENLFKACNEIPWSYKLDEMLSNIELPVMLRLMLSAGLRPIEARMLRCQDVNFENGIVKIVNTKGYRQHVVVLHDSMLQLLRAYHAKVSRLVGVDRIFMFPCGMKKQIAGQLDLFVGDSVKNETHRSEEWLKVKFRQVWDKYNTVKSTTVGMLRHHYAILNINSWTGSNQSDNLKRLLALSKSMGHRTLASTMWYYSLVPRLAELIDDLPDDNFDNIIPVFENDEI